jgi:2-polyprenyl-3-methyl-5-hydroxy-6-metoxy-1,4-benzoquinol methylase
MSFRGWEYAKVGDYHRNLDPNWSYTPTYLQKMKLVRSYIDKHDKQQRVLDLGCGEGLLVEEYSQKGHNIQGIDLNYESQHVIRGDITQLPYEDSSADLVLLLDVLEHIGFEQQPQVLYEIHRVLKSNGTFILSVPNLAHLNSRFSMFFFGALDRTDIETNHIGERPFREYETLLKNTPFNIRKQVGITFTVPFIYRHVICRYTAKFRWLHDLQEPLARRLPSLAMLTIFECHK